jgi:hypothetical protein
LLASSGADVKVVQELLRHANVSTAMNLHAQANSLDGRTTRNPVVETMLDARQDSSPEAKEAWTFPLLCLNVHSLIF